MKPAASVASIALIAIFTVFATLWVATESRAARSRDAQPQLSEPAPLPSDVELGATLWIANLERNLQQMAKLPSFR